MKTPTLLLILLVGLTPLLLLIFFVIAPTLSIVAWQPPNTWTDQFSPGPNFANGATSLFATNESLYAGGYLGFSETVNSSTSGLFIGRYDLSGHQIWIKLFGTPGTDEVRSVTTGSEGIIVAGNMNLRGFVKDYDPNGTLLWTSSFSSSQVGDDVDGAFEHGSVSYAVGYYRPANDSFIDELQAYDYKGNSLWTSTVGLDQSGGRRLNVYSDQDGIYVSSADQIRGMSFLQLYDFSGVLKWTRTLDCASCSATSVSGDGTAVYVGGYVTPIGLNGFFLNKYDSTGNVSWSRQFSTPYDSGTGVMTADASGIYFAIQGIKGGGSILKYESSGNRIWSLELRATLYAVAVSSNGVYVGGSTGGQSTTLSAGSTFLARFWQSSSLVLFGLNPPLSFVLLAGIVTIVVGTTLWLRRHYSTVDSSKKTRQLLKSVPSDGLDRLDFDKLS